MKNIDYQPVIIIGAARSGTNMLRDILEKIPTFGTWDCDEINPIWRHGNLNHPHDEFYASMATPAIASFIQKEFGKIAKSEGVTNVLEKSCANSLRVSFINEIFPNAKYIFIYRDGRDTVASASIRWEAEFDLKYTLKKLKYVPIRDLAYYGYKFGINRLKQVFQKEKQLSFWGVQIKNIQELLKEHSIFEICALQWKDCVDKSISDFEKINSEQIFKISYEEFVTAPQKNLENILSFLRVNTIDLDLAQLTAKVSSKSIGKYKQQLSTQTIEKINQLLSDTLGKLNYKD